MNDNRGCTFMCFALLFCIIGVIIANKVRDKYPQAIEVYQGKTTLEYKIVDGVVIDSCVVWKSK